MESPEKNETLVAGNEAVWNARAQTAQESMMALQQELRALESFLDTVGRMLRGLQPMNIRYRYGGRFDIRWWFTRGNDEARHPILVRWQKNKSGWAPIPVTRKPLLAHYQGIPNGAIVNAMVAEAMEHIALYTTRRSRYVELTRSFRQRPAEQVREGTDKLRDREKIVRNFAENAIDLYIDPDRPFPR